MIYVELYDALLMLAADLFELSKVVTVDRQQVS